MVIFILNCAKIKRRYSKAKQMKLKRLTVYSILKTCNIPKQHSLNFEILIIGKVIKAKERKLS